MSSAPGLTVVDLGNNWITAEAQDIIHDLLLHVADVKLDHQGMAMLLMAVVPCISPASNGNIDPLHDGLGFFDKSFPLFLPLQQSCCVAYTLAR